MRDREPLFYKFDFPANVRAATEKIAAAADMIPDHELMADNVEPLVNRLVRDHMFDIPVLSPDKVEADEGEIEVDVSHDRHRALFHVYGEPHYVKMTEYRFYVPYKGQRDAFFAKPSTWNMSPPYADVEAKEIVIRIIKHDEQQDAATIRKEFEKVLAEIETNLQRLRNDTNGHEDRLRQTAKARIDQRREKRKKDASIVTQMGFPKRGASR